MTSRALKNQQVAPRPSPIVARCGCGKSYSAATWVKLTSGGQQVIEATDTEPREVFELRQCSCGSTIAKQWNPNPGENTDG